MNELNEHTQSRAKKALKFIERCIFERVMPRIQHKKKQFIVSIAKKSHWNTKKITKYNQTATMDTKISARRKIKE